MSLRRRLVDTATIVRFADAGVDAYNTPIPAEGVRTNYPARLEQVGGRELTRGRQTIVADWRIFLPPEVAGALDSSDRIEVAGRSYEVAAPPEEIRDSGGQVHHVEAMLLYVAG